MAIPLGSNFPPPAVSLANRAPLSEAVVQLQRSVQVLEATVDIFRLRRTVSKEAKEFSKLLVATSKRLAAAVAAACVQRHEDLHVLAKAYITVAQESIDESILMIRRRVASGPIENLKLRSDTTAKVRSFMLGVQALEEMLKIKHGVARLISDPARRLGLSNAKPQLDLFTLSTSRVVSEGFKVVALGMANMTDGAPWPWKAIPLTILHFANMIERSFDQPRKIQILSDKISRRVALLLNVCETEGRGNQELNGFVEIFLADVQRIIVRVRVIEKCHSTTPFTLAEHIDKLIADEVVKMQDSFHELQMRFSVQTSYTVQSIAAGVAAAQRAADDILEVVIETSGDVKATVDAMHTLMVAQLHATAGSSGDKASYTISNSAKLPARPIFLNGRTEELDMLIRVILGDISARIAIMGTGGIGKTSLAKAILHDQRVVNLVGDHRFFISVEDLIDVDAAASRIAGQLGQGEAKDPQSAVIAILGELRCALLVIDNLESLWFSKNAAARQSTASFLQRLAGLTSVRLIVTCRGSVVPYGVQWSNAQFAELETLGLEAARETFHQIAGRPHLAAEETSLGELLVSVDRMPLAVTLLAQLALLKNPPSELLRRWRITKTKFISTGGDDRQSSVDVSIGVSLDLLKAMKSGNAAGQLLSICSHLPDGLRPSIFTHLARDFAGIDEARDLLVEFALVMVGADGELRMLNPVRHFILDNHPITVPHLALLKKIYFDVALSGPKGMDENFIRLSKNLATEFGNLTALLLHLIDSEPPSQELLDAVQAVSEYSYYTVPSNTLCEAFLAHLANHPAWRVDCLKSIGRTCIRRGEYSQAKEKLEAARKLFMELNNKQQLTLCGRYIGQYLQLQGLYDAAAEETTAARDAFIELGDKFQVAHCEQQLGSICRARGDYDQAAVQLLAARGAFERLGKRLGAAQCATMLGLVLLNQDNILAAESEFRFSRSEFEALGEQIGAAQCANYLGDVLIQQKDYPSAEKLLLSAQDVFRRLRSPLSLANSHHIMGRMYRDQQRLQEAVTNFTTARSIYETLGKQAWIEKCNKEIEQLGESDALRPEVA